MVDDRAAHEFSGEADRVSRRDFLKQSSLLTGTAAYAITLTTDARARSDDRPPQEPGGPGNTNYQYWEEP